jgi:glucose/arabinose dehydrogenase
MKFHVPCAMALLVAGCLPALAQQTVLTGQDAFTDYSGEHPGVRRHITVDDLPAPEPSDTVLDNPPFMYPRPAGKLPTAPHGFQVTLYADGFEQARLLRTAPNGDIFLASSNGGKIYVLRGVSPEGKAVQRSVFAEKLAMPFGIAFYPLGPNPLWVYIAYQTGVTRFPYKNGDLTASGPGEKIVTGIPGVVNFKTPGHWTRDIVFTPDGKHMLISVGSATDDAGTNDYKSERRRADVLEYTPQGKFEKIYAGGLRNCVGEAINPITGALWCSVNERNGLGDNLVPDYVTSVPENSFFGWPWWYIGNNLDPTHKDTHPKQLGPINVPDVLLPAHFASLEMTFYPTTPPAGAQPFPADFRGDGFAAEHGSGARKDWTGYEVIRIPMKNGVATGEFEDFLTGFTSPTGKVWGRPVGVTVGNDGSLFVSDDASNSVWRVSYSGK